MRLLDVIDFFWAFESSVPLQRKNEMRNFMIIGSSFIVFASQPASHREIHRSSHHQRGMQWKHQ
jgi:hypothetical protein